MREEEKKERSNERNESETQLRKIRKKSDNNTTRTK